MSAEETLDLLCPHCASPALEPGGREPATTCCCKGCGESFERALGLVRLCEAEAELASRRPVGPVFKLHRARATAELTRVGGAIATLGPDRDADQLDQLARAALSAGIVDRAHAQATLAVHPRSMVDPDPILAVGPGTGPTLLGFSLAMVPRQGESPVDFTLRVLALIVKAANGLVDTYYADGIRLDRSSDP